MGSSDSLSESFLLGDRGIVYSHFWENWDGSQIPQCPAVPPGAVLPLGISLPSLWHFVCCQEFLWQQSCPALFPSLCANKARQGRMETWKMSLHS